MARGLRVLGHPLHAVLSDFPLALLAVTLLWDILGLWRGEPLWWAMSFWTMAVGAASALPAAAAGFWDYIAIPAPDRAAGVALRHMLIMLSAVSAYAGSLLVRGGALPPVGATRVWALALAWTGLVLLGVGGWHGGHLVFHYGVGRSSPDVNAGPPA